MLYSSGALYLRIHDGEHNQNVGSSQISCMTERSARNDCYMKKSSRDSGCLSVC